MKNCINLFSGNIDELIERLKLVPANIANEHLEFAKEPNKSIAHKRLLAGDENFFQRYELAAKNEKVKGFTGKEYCMETEGLFFDTATFLTGQPEYWINEIDTPLAAPAKDILINIAAPHWVSEKDIFTKLIKVVELIDNAEAQGQRLSVKAVLFACNKRKDSGYNFEVEIKKESEPVNLQQLVYLFASPILLRYAALSLQYASGIEYTSISNIEEEKNQIGNEDFLYIPSISYDCLNDICKGFNQSFNYAKLDIINQYNISL